jgi:hypothetical protein
VETTDLIKSLRKELRPVTSVTGGYNGAIVMTGLALVLSAAGLPFLSFRPHVGEVLRSGSLFLFWVPLSATLFFGSVSLSFLGIPGRSDYRNFLRLAMGVFSILLAFLLLRGALTRDVGYFEEGFQKEGIACTLEILFLSVAPCVCYFWYLSRRAPTNLKLAGLMIGFIGSVSASILQILCCPNNHPIHLLSWHFFLPMAVMSVVYFGIGSRVLRW